MRSLRFGRGSKRMSAPAPSKRQEPILRAKHDAPRSPHFSENSVKDARPHIPEPQPERSPFEQNIIDRIKSQNARASQNVSAKAVRTPESEPGKPVISAPQRDRGPTMPMGAMGQMHRRKEQASNIQPLGEVSAEKIERLFNQRPDTHAPQAKKDPAPSKGRYRVQRILLTPIYRSLLRTGLPLLLLAGLGLYVLTNEDMRAQIDGALNVANENLNARPEFQVRLMKISGVDDDLATLVRNDLNLQLPFSSLEVDLNDLQERVELLDQVESATLRLDENNVLNLNLKAREAVVLWRKGDQLELLDRDGIPAGQIKDRSQRRDLPLIAGAASEDHIAQAVALFDILTPLHERVRGLRRMGERRWDVVLDRYQLIQLPEQDPESALRQVIALHNSQELLNYDVLRVDMRDPERMFVQMTPYANQIFKARQVSE